MERKDLSIVILSTEGSEYLPYLLPRLFGKGLKVKAIILDGKVVERDKQIQLERTKGFFEWPDFNSIKKYNIPVYNVDNHNGNDCVELLKQLEPDIILNGGTPRIIKKDILAIPKRGVVNSHPGILPKYRGCTCVEWAIFNNDPVGATCHFMSEGIDDGPIIYSEELKIKKGDIYEKIRAEMVEHCAKVAAEGLSRIVENDHSIENMQPQKGDSYFKVIPQENLNLAKKMLLDGLYGHYSS